MSSLLTSRTRYFHPVIRQQYEPVFLGTQVVNTVFFGYAFSAPTRRHIGAARTRDTSPAAINTCAS